jgi:hypothetical protein
VPKAVQFQARQHDYMPCTRLVLEANAISPATLYGQNKFLAPVSRSENALVIHRLAETKINRRLVDEDLRHLEELISLGLC